MLLRADGLLVTWQCTATVHGLPSLDLMPDGTPASRRSNEQATNGESDITFTYNDK